MVFIGIHSNTLYIYSGISYYTLYYGVLIVLMINVKFSLVVEMFICKLVFSRNVSVPYNVCTYVIYNACSEFVKTTFLFMEIALSH